MKFLKKREMQKERKQKGIKRKGDTVRKRNEENREIKQFEQNQKE